MIEKNLKIGDSLFHYAGLSGILEYSVIEIRKSIDNICYLIECQSCDHRDKCRLLICLHESPDKIESSVYKFICMIGDQEQQDEHYVFHNELNYFLTREESIIDRGRYIMREKRKKIEEKKEILEILEVDYKKFKKYIDDTIDLLKTNKKPH